MELLSAYRKSLRVLIDATLLRAGDPSGERFSTECAIEAINEAALEFAIEAQCIIASVPVRLEQFEAIYDLAAINAAYESKDKDFGWFLRAEFIDDEGGSASNPPGRYDLLSAASVELFDRCDYALIKSDQPAWMHKDLLSPNKMTVFPTPSQSGGILPDMDKNLLVWFVGLPNSMAEVGDYPDDQIQAQYHAAIPSGAAARLLDGGGEEDLLLADALDLEFQSAVSRAVGEASRGATRYDSVRPV